ncbi:hypothetical protein [Niveispirillum sp.]|uniref:hypothetical protein n=1 Tax=Niveispirillum sp. TaxID=1917217 RepID=UPI001B6D405F|nr:hypothetical protein [Niveispirillum sp.]MBP7336895.1 hypothetical protein [Niveispirillum sp.]
MMDYRQQLLTLAAVYRGATGRSEARVATIVHSQGTFFNRIRAGKGCSVDTYLKFKEWFAANWPPATLWPQGVDRPGIMPDAADPADTQPADAA